MTMGWWPFSGKGTVSAKRAAAPTAAEAAADAAAIAQARDVAAQLGADPGLLPVTMARPTSIFEFGEPVPVGGEVLRGMCAGTDPDAIQACTWSLEPVQGKGRERRPHYRVEF